MWELINLANKHPRVSILQPGCGVGGHCIAIDPYFITADFPAESKLIADAREINNYKSFWCAEKVKNAMLEFELKHHRKPCVAMMGLAFKPNIDDLRESPAKYITTKVMQSCNNANILVGTQCKGAPCVQVNRLQRSLRQGGHRGIPYSTHSVQRIRMARG